MPPTNKVRRTTIFFVVIVLVAGAIQIYLEGTSAFPWNLIIRPKSDATMAEDHPRLPLLEMGAAAQSSDSSSSADRQNAKAAYLARWMPLFMSSMQTRKRMDLRYEAIDGSQKRVLVYFSDSNELTIEHDIAVGSAAEVAAGKTRELHVTMVDRDRDGILDHARYQAADSVIHELEKPADEGSLAAWDLALSIAIAGSKCCEG
jgi:hypothetical protein